MTRELKLALIVGFLLVLLVSVLIADHLSTARKAQLDPKITQAPVAAPITQNPLPSEPLVTITQGRTGSIQEVGSGIPITTGQPNAELVNEHPSSDTTLARAIGNRAGEVLSGDRELPLQMSTGTQPMLTLSDNQLPGIDTLGANSADSRSLDLLKQTPAVDPTVIPFGRGTPATDPKAAILPAPKADSTVQTPPAKPASEATQPDRTHTVAAGESVYSIANKYYGNGEYWKQLAKANSDRVGKNGQLRVGVKLKIPAPSVLGIKTKTPDAATIKQDPKPAGEARIAKSDKQGSPEVAKADKTTKPSGKGREYIVKKGDSLSVIAQRELGTMKRMDEIMKLNKLGSAAEIRIGDKLVLPS